jgi:aspartokinase
LAEIGENKDYFFTISQGIFETNIVVSRNLKEKIDEIFQNENQIWMLNELASITLKLPKNNLEQSGIYYFILKQLAWADIPVQEIISTTNEMTIVVKESDVNRTFSILMDLKKD